MLFSCVRGHERSLPHLVNRVQTSNKAHDKFVPRRDCACADHSRPSLSPALLGGWSSHLVLIRFRLTTPMSQAPLLGQDELIRRKRDLDTRGHERSASHLVNHPRQPIRPSLRFEHALNQALFAKGW